MIFKKIIFSVLFFLFVISSFSQQEQYENCLKRTSVAIYKAQKQMIAAHSMDAQGKLAKAILFQSNAIKYYKDHNNSLAVCYCLLARQYAFEILQLLSSTGKVDAYYQVSMEEKQLSGTCLAEDQLYKQGRNNFSDYSANDKDYADPLMLKNYIEIK